MPAAAIVLVGGELLTGTRADTNGPWLSRQLRALGIEVSEIRYVPDDEVRIAEALDACAPHAEWIFVSGGLGPTDDDVTRNAVARAAGVPLVDDAPAWEAIRATLAARGREPASGERRQALLPDGAAALANTVGVAPGIRCRIRDATAFVFPGVPFEFQHLFDVHAREELAARRAGPAPASRTLWIAGLPESEAADRIRGLEALEGIEVASYPHAGELELVLHARGEGAEARARAAHAALCTRLGENVYDARPGERIEHAVVRALTERGARVATAESFTGGLLARMLTRVPGASAVFPVGWVTYATAEKTARLGVDPALIAEHGVASLETAAAMAEGALAQAGTDFALASTGSAGPDPIREDGRPPTMPGRVCLALARAGAPTERQSLDLPFARLLIQRYSAVRAFDMLRRALL